MPFPDIVALTQIATGYEMLGDLELARDLFTRMRSHAIAEGIAPYVRAADLGLERTGRA